MTELRAYYTVPELAKLMGRTRWQVRRLLDANDVRTHRIGRAIVVSVEAIRCAFPDIWEGVILRVSVQNVGRQVRQGR